MTRIVFHPANFPQVPGPRVLLAPPWRWWETHVNQRADGVLIEQTLTDAGREPRYVLTFGPDWDQVVLTDPPSFLMDTIAQYPARGCHDALDTCLPVHVARIRTVWHERPGEQWRTPEWNMASTRANTCQPGQYVHPSEIRDDSRRLPDRDAYERDWSLMTSLGRLRWPLNPTIIDGHPVTTPDLGPLRFTDRCRQCERYMEHSELTRARHRWANLYGLCDECHQMLRRVPTWDEITTRELNAAVLEFDIPNTGFPGQFDTISLDEMHRRLRAREQTDRRRNPEQNVLDDIEALVNDELVRGPTNFEFEQDRCDVCGGGWHGLSGTGPVHTVMEGTHGAESYPTRGNGGKEGCPGAFATEDEILQWRTAG